MPPKCNACGQHHSSKISCHEYRLRNKGVFTEPKCSAAELMQDNQIPTEAKSDENLAPAAPQVATSAETRPMRSEVEDILREVLRSATPHPIEHPTMYLAWRRANEYLTRAAAPVEPHAKECTGHCQICGWSHGECCDNPCACARVNSYRRNCDLNTLKKPATEPVEQAPRQEECPRCGGRNGSHQPGLPCWDKARRAASSPAARLALCRAKAIEECAKVAESLDAYSVYTIGDARNKIVRQIRALAGTDTDVAKESYDNR